MDLLRLGQQPLTVDLVVDAVAVPPSRYDGINVTDRRLPIANSGYHATDGRRSIDTAQHQVLDVVY
jgi:hypothetical protein